VRLIQHKREAYWFYRFLSLGYDRWVNPLFWTERMRARVLEVARLDDRELRTLDVGAGTGFTTEGVVEHVDASLVTMLDQSPHQLARSHRRPALRDCRRIEGDAEELPFPDGSFDRYVSAGSIEYWPDPARAIAEAHRVLRPGGVATVAGPLPPRNALARRLADAWMLFPTEAQYRDWFVAAGFGDVEVVHVAPEWHRGGREGYALAIAGVKDEEAQMVQGPAERSERLDAPLSPADRARFAARFVAGSAAGAAFVPIGAALAARDRLARRRASSRRS